MAELNRQVVVHEAVVVVPCFNEAQRLPLTEFSSFLSHSPKVSFVFVDDGSTDDTPLLLERLRQLYPRQVCTHRLSANVGKAEAVRRGMRAALRRRPTLVGYWDADLATPLDAITRFVDVLRTRTQIDLVMGSRVALLGRDIRRSTLRHFMGRVFATAASITLRLPVYDTQCGAKLFRVTPAFRELISQPFHSRWIFDVEVLARMIHPTVSPSKDSARAAIYEYPLEEWRDISGSRLTLLDFVVAGIDLISIYWRYRRSSVPHQTVALQTSGFPTSDPSQRQAA